MKKPLLPLLLFIFTFSAFGQEFSPDWQKVPATFQGHDYNKIYSTFFNSPALKEKGEFETTEQYNKRKNDLSKIDLGDGLNASSNLYFVYKPPVEEASISGLSAKYDADKEVLLITIDIRKAQSLDITGGGIKQQGFQTVQVLPSRYLDMGEYTASNAYGRQATVKKSSITYSNLAIQNIYNFPDIKKGSYMSKMEFSLKLPPDRAKQVKENLAALYAVKLKPPFHALDGIFTKPTINSPRETSAIQRILVGDVSDIWLFNAANGEILLKLKPQF